MHPLGFALAIGIGVSLGFFGGGGSILAVPLLVYVFGLAPKEAIASSLLIVAGASASGALHHARAGNVELRTALPFGAAGVAGAYLGGRGAAFVDGRLLLLLFAAVMALTATAMWRGRRPGAREASGRRDDVRLVLQGFAVGLFTGLVGAGGGFLVVPALVLWAGLSMQAAVGTSLAIIVINSLAGFSGYVAHVRVAYGLVGAVTASAIVGSLLGSRLARRIDPTALRRAFALFVLAMAALIVVREADTWFATARAALPESVPQVAFVSIVLLLGIVMGRASQKAGVDPLAEGAYEHGGGI